MSKETLTPELEAIKKVEAQIEKFNDQLGEKAEAEELKKLGESLEEIKKGVNEMSEKELDKKIEEINEGMNKQLKLLDEHTEKINQIREGANSKGFGEKMLTKENIEKFLDEVGKGPKAKIEFKAAETFGFNQTFNGDGTGVQIDAFTGREVDPTFYQRKRKSNLILDAFAMNPISVPKLIYLMKEEDSAAAPISGNSGGAAWILSGAAKPKRSFRVTTGEVEAKKVAIFSNIEDKLLRDVSSFENWIREDLTDEMKEAINDGLLNNDPGVNANAPLGLKTNAVQYAATPAYGTSITDSNTIEQIIASIAFMRYNKEEAAVAYVSSDVFYKIHHLKGSDEHFLNSGLVYIDNVGRLFIAGVQIVPTDEEDVPSTHLLLIGAENGFKIRPYGNMVIEKGLNGEDFREDKTSFRGYQEFLSYIPTHRENSVMYDTFANIKTAIDTP